MNAQNQGYQQQQYQYQYQGQQQNANRSFQQNNAQNKAGQQQASTRNRKPIHTAFFSNVPFDYPYEKFKEFVESFGEISYMYSLIKDKGFAFVTYSDIRNAQKAVEKGCETFLNGRPVRTNYANKSHFSHLDPTDTCATILVKSLKNPSKMTIHEVISKMKDFGEIMSGSPVEGQPGVFVIKYYNIKDAHKAMENNLPQIGSETASLEYKLEDEDNPDIQTQPKPNMQFQVPRPNQPMYGMPPNMGYPQQPPNMQANPQYPRMPQQQTPQQPPIQGQPQQAYYGQMPGQPPPYYNQMPGQPPPPSYGMNPQQQQQPPPPPQSKPSLSPNTVEKLKNLQMQMQMKKKNY